MMKTPIQELIAQLEGIQKTNCKTAMEMLFFDGVLAVIHAENYLDKERTAIVDAFDEGYKSSEMNYNENGEKYFIGQYSNNEKE